MHQTAASVVTSAKQPSALYDENPWQPPHLRFLPTAWAKLLFLRDAGFTEVGGFGITSAEDLLLVEDIKLVRQVCTAASVAFDDQSVADFFDNQVDAGRKPAQFARIWLHTHPGNSPEPSRTDEQTFSRVFGPSDWAAMLIVARGGRTYCRLRFNVGPGGEMDLPVQIDFSRPFPASDHAAWHEEYKANVEREEPVVRKSQAILTDRLGHVFEPFERDTDWPDPWADPWDDAPLPMEVHDGSHI
jgi:proteasome lid subunit RPN8/RPN11